VAEGTWGFGFCTPLQRKLFLGQKKKRDDACIEDFSRATVAEAKRFFMSVNSYGNGDYTRLVGGISLRIAALEFLDPWGTSTKGPAERRQVVVGKCHDA
jgi:hypothetical protein